MKKSSPLLPKRFARTRDRKSTRLNSSHANISYAVFCLRTKKHTSELQSRQYLVCRLLLEKKRAQVVTPVTPIFSVHASNLSRDMHRSMHTSQRNDSSLA